MTTLASPASHGPASAAATDIFAAHEEIWDRIARWCLMTAIFLSGWGLLRVGQINLTFSDLFFLISFSISALRGRLSVTPFRSLTPFWLAGLVMMLGGLFIGSIINGDPLRWVNIALQYTVAFLCIPILLMQQEEGTIRKAPLIFMLGIACSEAVGIAASAFLTYHDTLHWLGDGFITGNGRLGSMAGQPNPNGAVVAFSLPMLLYSMRHRLIGGLAGVACLILLLWGLMLSASFTGFSASLLAIFTTLLLMGVRYIFRLGLAVAVAAGLFFASGAPLPKAFQERVGNAVESGDINQAGTFLNRSQLMEEAWDFAEDYTVIGMGVDRYRELSAYDNPVHNLFLLIWNEGGAIAFCGLILLLGLIALLAANGLRTSRDKGAMAVAVVLVFLIYTLSYPHMYSRMWVMPVMVALATIYVPRKARPEAARLIYARPVGPQPLPEL
ncbi:O-antigen ligase family protein [Sphingobium sp. PNB]|uniref:O-antigen ligase family protein n=1 Tax=Sphingobium sp. PNB TaxID=863934 RepID=UPI001CA3CC94|nr:O-antigen ligase family protein [Sphingobium sp. PNB]MCB4859921.1 O-antigen ligase family protein [Sphingobium sp. PNB]